MNLEHIINELKTSETLSVQTHGKILALKLLKCAQWLTENISEYDDFQYQYDDALPTNIISNKDR